MNLTPLTTDLNAHQNLPDQPTATAQELKIAWDKPANDIKTYINNTLLPDVTSGVNSVLSDAKAYTDSAVGAISLTAENISYDNDTSGLTADDIQGAIDEVKTITATNASAISTLETSLLGWIHTQPFSVTVTQNGYTDKTTRLGTLNIPEGYTYIGTITTTNTNPTRITTSYEIGTDNSVYVRTNNYSDINALRTTVKCNAIYLKGTISQKGVKDGWNL